MTIERRPPDLSGLAGSAWRLPTAPTTVSNWLLHAPGAHPFWSWYLVSCCHLRAVEGVPAGEVRKPGAQHELGILCVDPQRCPEPDPEAPVAEGYPFLTPPNLMEQFIVPTDEGADRVTELMVKAFVAGACSPDTDFRRLQEQLLAGTAEHERLGGHPDTLLH